MLEQNSFMEDQHLRASPIDYSYLTPETHFITNNYFYIFFFGNGFAADYQNPITKDKVEGWIPII